MIYMCILRIQTTCGNLGKDLHDIFINVGMPGSFLNVKIATDTIDFIQNRLNSPHLSNVMP